MATVAVNDRLHDRVEAVVNGFKGRERTRLEAQFLRNLPDIGDPIYRTLVGDDHIAWTDKAPAGMHDMVSKIVIAGLGPRTIGLDLPLEKPAASPSKTMMFDGGMVESGFKSLSVRLNENFPAWQPLIGPADTLDKRRAKLLEDTKLLNQFVLKLFREAKSLGPILRMWPPLWDILSDEDRRKQGAKPYGAAIPIPSWIAAQYDVNAMTAMVVRIKMAAR